MLKLVEKDIYYTQLKDNYAMLIENREGTKILNTIEAINIYTTSFGDMGARILGLGLLKNTNLLYLAFSIFLKE